MKITHEVGENYPCDGEFSTTANVLKILGGIRIDKIVAKKLGVLHKLLTLFLPRFLSYYFGQSLWINLWITCG